MESLQKRADALLTRVREVLSEQRMGGFGFLVQALDQQSVYLEALSMDLKAQLAMPDAQIQLHHIHVIEEDLLR